MTPDFALHFSVDGITLAERQEGGWRELGSASFTSGNFGTEVAALKESGDAAAAAGDSKFATKLVLPNDQLKFLTLRDGNATELSVSLALEGATPYAVTDLAFDWQSGGGTTRVAAVARETLQEAEAFALEHGLAPIAFVALPDDGWSGTEAFFGTASNTLGLDPRRDPLPYRALTENAPTEAVADDIAPEPVPGPESEPEPVSEDHALDPGEGIEALEDTFAEAANDAEQEGLIVDETPFVAAPRAAEPEEPVSAPTTFQSIRRPAAGAPPPLGAARADAPPPVERRASLRAEPTPIAAPAAPAVVAPRLTDMSGGSEGEASTLAASLRPGAADATNAVAAADPFAIPPKPRGKPRFLGLILTVILILALLAVAALAAVRGDGLAGLFRFSVPDAPEAPATALAIPETALPVPDSVSISPIPIAPAPLEPEIAVVPEQVPAAPLVTEAELERFYAATGIWKQAPEAPRAPLPSQLDTLYTASIDSDVYMGDAVALDLVARLDDDRRPTSKPLPPAASARFQFDARGLLIATPEGTVSPLGYTLFAGRPPIEPPFRIPETAPANPEIAQLASIRPRLRPEDLLENAERLALGGLTRAEFAAFRPKARPDTVKAPEEVEEPDAPPSELAIATSRRPESRPRNFDRVVAKARASQPTTVAVAAAVAPRVTQPSGPTRTSVARAATTQNAINLRRVNLIGVYGTPSNRSALVRLANGRFVKVQVGDRVDGGRVAAISESALRYVKGGRNITLEIPTG